MNNQPNNYDYCLSLFKSTETLRPHLCKVFPQENYYIATDAHTVIYVDKQFSGLDYPIEERSVDALKFLHETLHDTEIMVDKNDILSQLLNVNFEWNKTFFKCEKCSGTGEQECQCCNNISDCKECDGTGYSDEVKPFSRVELRGEDLIFAENRFDSNLFHRMVQTAFFLEAKKITVKYTKHVKNKPVIFLIENATVLIMPKIG